MKTQLHDFFLLRKPLLPKQILLEFNQKTSGNKNFFEQEIIRIFSSPELIDAVYLASPSLHRSLIELLEGNYHSGRFELCCTLYKYLTRMCTRPTPFGLFASWIDGVICSKTSFIINASSTKRNLSLDANLLVQISDFLAPLPQIRAQMRVFSNTSIHYNDHFARYHKWHDRARAHYDLAEAQISIHLKIAIEKARYGATLEEIADSIQLKGIQPEDATQFVDSLVDAGVLISELDISAVTVDPLKYLIERLKDYKQCESQVLILTQIQGLLETEGPVVKKAKRLAELLTDLEIIGQKKAWIKADLSSENVTCSLSGKAVRTVLNELENLHVLNTDKQNSPLDSFARKFYDRYQNQEVDLLTALDTDYGIGYGDIGSGFEDIPLLEHLDLSSKNGGHESYQKLDLLKLQFYQRALKTQSESIEITEADLKSLGKENRRIDHQGEGGYVMGSFLSENTQELDKGNFTFVHQASGGPSGFNLMARFCNHSHVLKSLVTQAVSWEALREPSVIFAEINHVSDIRSANVLMRPHLRMYEIPYLSISRAKSEHQILPCDLMISVNERCEIVLRSKRLNKIICPRLTNAHNYVSGLPVYRFLCDLARRNDSTHLNWDWGFLGNQKFLPRITYRHLILAKATWNISASCLSKNSGKAEWRNLCDSGAIPRYVQINEGDNLLLIDNENEISIGLALDLFKSKGKLKLTECPEMSANTLSLRENETYHHEVIIPFLPAKHTIIPDLPTPCFDKVRHFLPGSEWLYMKIYCGSHTADWLLVSHVNPICQMLISERIIDKWFFIRYNDPDHHLRIRLHLTGMGAHYYYILDCFNRMIEPLVLQKIIHKLTLDTYQRELERYDQLDYDFAESVFCCETTAIVDALSQPPALPRWQIALRIVDGMLSSLDLDTRSKTNFCRNAFEGLLSEYDNVKALKININEKYRSFKEVVQTVLDPLQDSVSGMVEVLSHFHVYFKVLSHLKRNTKHYSNPIEPSTIASLIHMMLNRLFVSLGRQQEMVVYHFLYKYYNSVLFQAENKPTVIKNQALIL